jgi:cbb3-type cytochrome oxidase subunit 3
MSIGILHGIWSLAILLMFIGIVAWVWSASRRRHFEDAGMIPFLEDHDDAAGSNRHE